MKFCRNFWIFFCFFGIPFKVTTKSYQGYYWEPTIAKKGQNSIISSLFFPEGQQKALDEGRSPPQELEVGPRSGPYLLVQITEVQKYKLQDYRDESKTGGDKHTITQTYTHTHINTMTRSGLGAGRVKTALDGTDRQTSRQTDMATLWLAREKASHTRVTPVSLLLKLSCPGQDQRGGN